MKLFTWFTKKYYDYKNQYNNLNSNELFELTIHYCSKFINLIGIRILSDCRVDAFSFACVYCIFIDTLLCMYTSYYYWSINKMSAVQPYAIFAMAIPVRINVLLSPSFKNEHINIYILRVSSYWLVYLVQIVFDQAMYSNSSVIT